MKTFRILPIASLAFVSVFILTSGVPAPKKTSSAEQIVFSGTGSSTLGPFGFWVWSESAEATNPYHGEVAGAVYLYALGLTKAVDGTISEGPDGVYHISFFSSDGSIVGTLVNATPVVHGPRNTVWATFSTPSGSGVSTTAVVNITGPQ